MSDNGSRYANIVAATSAVTNRFVTTTNMKVGAYTIANAAAADGKPHLVTITVSKVVENDTMGTITLTGTDDKGATISETLVPNNGDTSSGLVTSTKAFATLTDATGAGWVSGGTPDTIVIGYSASTVLKTGTGILRRIIVGTTAAGAIVFYDNVAASGTKIATLKSSIAEGVYEINARFSLGLTITAAAASDFTVIYD